MGPLLAVGVHLFPREWKRLLRPVPIHLRHASDYRAAVSINGAKVLDQTFTYSTTWPTGYTNWTTKTTTVTTTDEKRNISFTTTYTYGGRSVANPPYETTIYASQIPVEQSLVYTDWNGNKLRGRRILGRRFRETLPVDNRAEHGDVASRLLIFTRDGARR